MDILLTLTVVALLGMGGFCFYQSRRHQAFVAAIRGRDEEIGSLRSRLIESEHEVLQDKAYLATVAEVSFDMILLLDEALSIVNINQTAGRLLHQAESIGKRLSDVIDSPELINLVELALRESESLEEQLVIGESNYRVRAQAFEFVGQGRFVGIAMQDITDLVQLNRARRDLVANISHELRTPITRIRLIIEGLFLDADKPKRKASIQSLKEIAMETDALLWLAQELLDLSMIESGQAILRLVKTPLKRVVDEAIERLDSQAETKHLKIFSHIPQDFDVLCDADQLKRVLGNLLHNAIKWSPRNDAITIAATETIEEIVVTVFDNGPGVPDEVRERIFERFYQADVSRSGDVGTGLGLAICKHIIEAHGGRIWAEGSSLGTGGRFVFTVLKADANFQQEASETDTGEPLLEVPNSVATL